MLRIVLAALALGSLGLGAALAQPATDAKPLKATEVENHGAWTVRCFAVHTATPCDMYESLSNKTSGKRVLGISIGYVPSTDKHVIQIAVPLGISVPQGLTVEAGSYVSPALAYRRCDPSGCYVEAVCDNRMIDAMATAEGQGRVRIASDDGKKIAITFVLNGFAEAHGAMTELARKKVSASTEQ